MTFQKRRAANTSTCSMCAFRACGMAESFVRAGRPRTVQGPKLPALMNSRLRIFPARESCAKATSWGVLAEREWDAVRAARDLKIRWDIPAVLPSSDHLHEAMRAETTSDRVVLERGDVDDALKGAAHVAAGQYRAPYQAHAP